MCFVVAYWVFAGSGDPVGSGSPPQNGGASDSSSANGGAAQLSGAYVADLVMAYYDNQGQWSGTYVIQRIDGGWFRLTDGYDAQACVAYDYAGVSAPSVPVSGDTRIFYLSYTDGDWQVVGMAGEESCAAS
jgi:hypothetical protein